MAIYTVPLQSLIVLALISSTRPQFSSTNNSSKSSFDLADPHRITNDTLECRPGSSNCAPNDDGDRGQWFNPHLDNYLSSSAVLYGMIRQSSPLIVSPQCHSNLETIAEAIHRRDVWAMKSEYML